MKLSKYNINFSSNNLFTVTDEVYEAIKKEFLDLQP